MMPASRESESYARFALVMLLLVYAFNFIDRIILGILVPPIKADLHLTDTQLGLVGGTAFARFYTALGMPIGWLADRFNRVWIITVSLALWSAFAAASGLAQNFVQLFMARLGVGIGEASGVPEISRENGVLPTGTFGTEIKERPSAVPQASRR
jgi:MFS family permease